MLSLIICTYMRPAAIATLLAALGTQRVVPDEVLIVDGSTDSATEAVVAAYQADTPMIGLRYERVPAKQRGLTRQRNYGIARACGEIIAFLDDDTVPEPAYFAEIVACFDRHPEALGVGAYITDELAWRQVGPSYRARAHEFAYGGWVCREDYRWRIRNRLGLGSALAPGWMPPSGHGRSVGRIPPDGADHRVEFMMGGVAAWRRSVFQIHRFSPYFAGYGLYEDLDFCVRVARDGPLWLCTRARVAHYHAADGRPNRFHYGVMVVRNGWFVWRRRWPRPAPLDRARWWAVEIVMGIYRLGAAVRQAPRRAALSEAFGRLWGGLSVLVSPPRESEASHGH